MAHPMPRGLKPLDPCSPPEPELPPETVRKMSTAQRFAYAFDPNAAPTRNLRRRQLGGAQAAPTNGPAGAADG